MCLSAMSKPDESSEISADEDSDLSTNENNELSSNEDSKSSKISLRSKRKRNNSENTNTVLINSILNKERLRINLDDKNKLNAEDEECKLERIRKQLLRNERKRLFSKNSESKRPKPEPKSTKLRLSTELPILQSYKLRKMFYILNKKPKLNKSETEFKKCLNHMHPPVKPIWTTPANVMKAVTDCMLTRNWNSLTYMLQELIHFNGLIYKSLIRNVYTIMDQLHPVIYENDMQGEFKKIRKYHQKILDNTTVV